MSVRFIFQLNFRRSVSATDKSSAFKGTGYCCTRVVSRLVQGTMTAATTPTLVLRTKGLFGAPHSHGNTAVPPLGLVQAGF